MPVQASSTNAAPPEDAVAVAKYFCELDSHERAWADSYRHLNSRRRPSRHFVAIMNCTLCL
jgi:hypothetical protein